MTPFSRELCYRSCKLHFKARSVTVHTCSSLENGVLTTPKRHILSFVFAVICFSKSLNANYHYVVFKKTRCSQVVLDPIKQVL